MLMVICLLGFYPLFSQTQSTQSESQELPTFNSISVTIGGYFITTGTFPASPAERVDQFITRTYNYALKSREIDKDAVEKILKFSKRNITLKRISGEAVIIDLEKFRITGDFKFNPYLRNDDVLIIPPANIKVDFISIYGAVNVPQVMQFIEGDKLSDAILLAQGINPAYENVTTAIISRLSTDGNTEEQISVNISDDPPLKRGDRIKIAAEEIQKKDYKVYVDGEVNYPGDIPITKNNTTLRDVFIKCGGTKQNADLNRAEIIRGSNVFRSTLFTEEFEYFLMQRMSKISKEDSLSFAVDNKLRFSRGNATINFNNVMEEGSVDGNFIVKDGDYIFIPEKLELVYIFGQVNSPGYVAFQEEKDFSYYIQKAGGVGLTAKKEIYLIKGKTRSWIQCRKDTEIGIEPGDYIWVPKKPIHDFNYYLTQVGSVAAVVGSIATLIVLLIQVTTN